MGRLTVLGDDEALADAGLVLAGGGARGAYTAPALSVLLPRLGDQLRVIVGSSSQRWAPNIVTACARSDERPGGVIANQPRHLGGVLAAETSQKGGKFVRTCNAFGIPIVALVATPGFLPETEQEALGVIRHGAKLLHAFAAATVPRYTVGLRKACGGAYIRMNSKDLGAAPNCAWSRAQLGIMGASDAAGIIKRREIQASDDPGATRERRAGQYVARHLDAGAAAHGGHVDEVLVPGDTRSRLASALNVAADDRGGRGRNIPRKGGSQARDAIARIRASSALTVLERAGGRFEPCHA